jgi:arylsulfatase A-like enzyme
VLGPWESRLHHDGRQGTLWLAALRVAAALPPAAASAAALVAALPGLTLLVRRPRRAGILRSAVLLATAALAVTAAVAILRARALALAPFGGAGLEAACVTALVAVGYAFLSLQLVEVSRLARVRLVRPLRRAAAALGLVGLGLGLAFDALAPALGARRAAPLRPVVLVSLDTLRADRTGFTGATRPLTPRLDALAAEGAVFEQAASAAPWTLPAHVSLFTSLLPFEHGVRWPWQRVHPARSMLAERFRDAGYRTAAFTGGAFVAGSLGYAQGFETYADHDEQIEGGPEAVVAAALEWVREVRDEPFFLFVHSYEPHAPFERPGFARPEDAGRLPARIGYADVDAIHAGKLVLDEKERGYVVDLYDGDVRNADRVVGGFLARLRDEGMLDRAILVVLSDHGEDLWDHEATRSPGHGHSLYEELLHVPLFVRAPGLVPGPRRIRTPVSLLDVAPTLLDLAGLPPDPGHAGRSLARALRDGVEPEPRPILAESVQYGPDRFSRREGSTKVVVTPEPRRQHEGLALVVRPLEVFDLGADPGERRDVSGAPDPKARRMAQEVRSHAAERMLRPEPVPPPASELSEPMRRQLRSLGYTEGAQEDP